MKKAAPFLEPPTFTQTVRLPAAAAMTAISTAVAIAANMPAAAIAIADKAHLLGLDTAGIDGADISSGQGRSRSRKSNREGAAAIVSLMMFIKSPYDRANLNAA